MTRGTWSFLAALILGLALPVVAQQGPPPVLVVPGQSLAGVVLGRSASSSLGRLGPPADIRELRDSTLHAFPRYGLNVYVTDGIVRAVSTTNSLLRTAEGIALGSTAADVRRVYGGQFADAVVEGLLGMAYDQHGIAFGLDGVVVSIIIIYAPRTQAAPPAAAPAVTAPTPQFEVGLVSLPRVENLKSFTPETQYMSVVGFLRYLVYQQTSTWLTHSEANRMLQDQRMRVSRL
ncbi:MAG: hypothetical protein ACT4PY_04215 [Armatimonadota bacterium]